MSELFQRFAPEMERVLREANPWWAGIRETVMPFRRWLFPHVLKAAKQGIAPITVVRGPRQVGKTTLAKQVIAALLDEGVAPQRIFRVQFDDLPGLKSLGQLPVLNLAWWFADTVLAASYHEAAQRGEAAILVFDEVQNLADWSVQLKQLVDLQPVRVIVTGSSALRIEAGRDSLAGRITTLEMGPLLLREIGEMRGLGHVEPFLPLNGLRPLKDKDFWLRLRRFGEEHREFRDAAFRAFSERGGYPMAHAFIDEPWERIADQLNETVVKRAIQHDLRMGEKGKKRDEHLLEEVFRLSCRYIGQSPTQALYLDEIKRALDANIGWQRVLAYLKFLDGALLVRLIEPLELRLKRRRGSSKLVLCDHALRAAWLQEFVPLAPDVLSGLPHLADLAGRIAESCAGQFFKTIVGLDVAHFPERGAEPEVDYVLTVGEQRIPVEVKYRRRIDHADTRGLRSFLEKAVYNAPFGILVTQNDDLPTDDPRIVSLPLSSLLLMR